MLPTGADYFLVVKVARIVFYNIKILCPCDDVGDFVGVIVEKYPVFITNEIRQAGGSIGYLIAAGIAGRY